MSEINKATEYKVYCNGKEYIFTNIIHKVLLANWTGGIGTHKTEDNAVEIHYSNCGFTNMLHYNSSPNLNPNRVYSSSKDELNRVKAEIEKIIRKQVGY